MSSGLFLGWSMGANDASNAFGTAVATRMVRFSTAAFLCSVFVIIGAVRDGAGATGGLGQLGAINALPGSFTAALAAAVTVGWMSKLGLPTSTTQAVVGAIIGWNWFSGSITNLATLTRILLTWIASPVLGGIFAVLLYSLLVQLIRQSKPHLVELDRNVRIGLILAGVFGSYAMGANGIANVMGFFVPSSPFRDLDFGSFIFSSTEQLFLIGSIAIAVGVFTYSKRVMMTVGSSLMTLSPVGAFVVVVAHSLVLFIFSSTALESFLDSLGLPTIPLLPVSGSQAVIGAILGIGLLQGMKGVRQIQWGVLAGIASGWV
ncbi:MAG: inorganic phosphate transporter, partial [Microcystaceae cyanobacterium]